MSPAEAICSLPTYEPIYIHRVPVEVYSAALKGRRFSPVASSKHLRATMLPNPLHKEFLMKMHASLANPILVALYSTALLFIGAGVGVHWTHALPTALWMCVAGGIFMAVHDLATGFVWFWLTARWVHSMMIRRDNRG